MISFGKIWKNNLLGIVNMWKIFAISNSYRKNNISIKNIGGYMKSQNYAYSFNYKLILNIQFHSFLLYRNLYAWIFVESIQIPDFFFFISIDFRREILTKYWNLFTFIYRLIKKNIPFYEHSLYERISIVFLSTYNDIHLIK